MHPEDIAPYRSRWDLFETIRQQRIQLDQKDDEICKLKGEEIEINAGWEPCDRESEVSGG